MSVSGKEKFKNMRITPPDIFIFLPVSLRQAQSYKSSTSTTGTASDAARMHRAQMHALRADSLNLK